MKKLNQKQMNVNDVADAIKQQTEKILPVILEEAQKNVNGKPSYICPFCGHGKGGDGLAVIPSKNGRHSGHSLKCFGCNFTGTVIDLVMQRDQISYGQAIEKLADLCGLEVIETAQGKSDHTSDHRSTETEGERRDFTKYLEVTRGYLLNSPKALQYLHTRGISDQTVRLCKYIGFDPQADPSGKGYKSPRLLFFKDNARHYNSRVIEGEGLPATDPQYKKMKPAGVTETGYFMIDDALDQMPGIKSNNIIVIVEGEIDALSVYQIGECKAVALSSYGRSDSFVRFLKDHRKEYAEKDIRFIVSLDNDQDSATRSKVRQTADQLTDQLRSLGFRAVNHSISGKYKDANDALVKDAEYLKEQIRSAINEVNAADSDTLYDMYYADAVQPTYDEQIQSNSMTYDEYLQAFNGAQHAYNLFTSDQKLYDPTATGFRVFDDNALNGGLYEGLYIIGASPSLGKTTFVMQIADQIAYKEKDVLIFSLEMSKNQLIAKSISRETHAIIDENMMPASCAMDYLQVLRYKMPHENEELKGADLTRYQVITEALNNYRGYGTHIFIHESYFDVTAETIRKQIDLHKHLTGNVPLVVVDYLQIMGCEDKGKRTDKERTDYNVSKLKKLSNDYHTPIIAISSVNRATYGKGSTSDITMNAMKESGGIEYGADAVIGLQFTDKEKTDSENMQANPREVTAVVLKNRFGAVGSKVNFSFYAKYNRFIEKGAEVF